jgi:ubiquinone/menaquinone biosynthesis C-methylase UbiE
MDHNVDVYNEFAHEYAEYHLYRPERVILHELKHLWPRARMLDIGVGTGRTTVTFGAIAREYIGIDYAHEMLNRARRHVPENSDIKLQQCDARDLSEFYDNPFDVVLFSLNGLDSVSNEDRTKILAEVRKVLKPDGYFIFSSHSLRAFKPSRPLPRLSLTSPIRSLYYWLQAAIFNARLKWEHRNIDVRELRKRDWAVLKTGDHDFKMDIYHVHPEYQVRVLKEHGFEVESVLDTQGKYADVGSSDSDWLYFVCRAARAGAQQATCAA